jgi:threonine/homoserine/homoserine lactone efflux protein
MLIYAVTVVVGIVGLTLALVAGYHAFEARVERLSEYFPTISGVVLIGMGLGFLFGVF